jgi:hypothetical protein
MEVSPWEATTCTSTQEFPTFHGTLTFITFRLERFLTMVYNTHDYWVFGLVNHLVL